MRKNGDPNVVNFVCAKGRRVGSRRHLCNLTNMHRKASACLGPRVALVPESYHRFSSMWIKLQVNHITALPEILVICNFFFLIRNSM
jgi:hypothetical protein